MALSCGFFNSLSGDRKYNSVQMSHLFDGIIKDGVFDSIGQILATIPGEGMQVLVGTGKAWFNHTWTENDAAIPLAIAAADVTLGRYDAVILEVDSSDGVRNNSIKVITGTPASTPVKPSMTNTETVFQHPLAYIYVAGGAASITLSNIQNVIGTTECPFVTALLESVSIDSLFGQWQGDFDAWFDNVQAQLEGNVVTNLQNQINDRVKTADKATNAEAIAGTDDSKWMTPAKTKAQLIFDNLFSIGDIISTARSSIASNWLPCNGVDINAAAFPQLSALIPISVGKATFDASFPSANMNIPCISMQKVGAYYVFPVTGGIFYSTNIRGPYTYKALSGYRSYTGLMYDGTYYGYITSGDGSGSPVIHYCSTIEGTYATYTLSIGYNGTCSGACYNAITKKFVLNLDSWGSGSHYAAVAVGTSMTSAMEQIVLSNSVYGWTTSCALTMGYYLFVGRASHGFFSSDAVNWNALPFGFIGGCYDSTTGTMYFINFPNVPSGAADTTMIVYSGDPVHGWQTHVVQLGGSYFCTDYALSAIKCGNKIAFSVMLGGATNQHQAYFGVIDLATYTTTLTKIYDVGASDSSKYSVGGVDSTTAITIGKPMSVAKYSPLHGVPVLTEDLVNYFIRAY